MSLLKKPKSFMIVLNNLFEEANADDDEERRDQCRAAVGRREAV